MVFLSFEIPEMPLRDVFFNDSAHPRRPCCAGHATFASHQEKGPRLAAAALTLMKQRGSEVNIFHVGAVIGACRSLRLFNRFCNVFLLHATM